MFLEQGNGARNLLAHIQERITTGTSAKGGGTHGNASSLQERKMWFCAIERRDEANHVVYGVACIQRDVCAKHPVSTDDSVSDQNRPEKEK